MREPTTDESCAMIAVVSIVFLSSLRQQKDTNAKNLAERYINYLNENEKKIVLHGIKRKRSEKYTYNLLIN